MAFLSDTVSQSRILSQARDKSREQLSLGVQMFSEDELGGNVSAAKQLALLPEQKLQKDGAAFREQRAAGSRQWLWCHAWQPICWQWLSRCARMGCKQVLSEIQLLDDSR